MEKYLNRTLEKSEVIHHKDGNPANNSIENLILFPNQSTHAKYYYYIRKGKIKEAIALLQKAVDGEILSYPCVTDLSRVLERGSRSRPPSKGSRSAPLWRRKFCRVKEEVGLLAEKYGRQPEMYGKKGETSTSEF